MNAFFSPFINETMNCTYLRKFVFIITSFWAQAVDARSEDISNTDRAFRSTMEQDTT